MKKPTRVSHVSSAPPARRESGLVALLAFAPLVLVGEWIVSHTHHRPLGAVTFAAFALGLWVALELFVRQGLSEPLRLPREGGIPVEAGGPARPRGAARAESLSARTKRVVVWAWGGIASLAVVVRVLL